MSDTPAPPEASGDTSNPAPLAPEAKRPWTILGRLSKAVREQNWFAVVLELAIVVLGVLIAFQVTNWGQERAAAAKETVYLRQLVADLRETERIMRDRNATMAARTEYSVMRLYLSFGTRPRPPRDSVEKWLVSLGYISSPRPVLGTAEALVASGDFGAVRNDSLRSAILRYLDLSREAMADQVLFLELARKNLHDLQRLGWSGSYARESQRDLREMDILHMLTRPRPDSSGRAASPDWQYPFPYDAMEIFESQEFFEVLHSYSRNIGTLQGVRHHLGGSAIDLREQVTAVIGE